MTVSIGVKAVMVMVSGHSQKILVLVECTVTKNFVLDVLEADVS